MSDNIDDDDIKLFHQAVNGVKPLKQPNKIILKKTKPKPRLKQIKFNDPEPDFLSNHLTETVSGEQALFFAKSGLKHKTIKALKQGKIYQSAELDLHRMIVEEARLAVTKFLAFSLKNNLPCVRIIHGKGKTNPIEPILKNHLNAWLKQHPDILAFCSATLRDGGTGAVYVLLKTIKT